MLGIQDLVVIDHAVEVLLKALDADMAACEAEPGLRQEFCHGLWRKPALSGEFHTGVSHFTDALHRASEIIGQLIANGIELQGNRNARHMIHTPLYAIRTS